MKPITTIFFSAYALLIVVILSDYQFGTVEAAEQCDVIISTVDRDQAKQERIAAALTRFETRLLLLKIEYGVR